MKKIISIFLIIVISLISFTSCKKKANPVYSGSVMIYIEADEEVAKKIKSGFEDIYKGIVLDYYYGDNNNIKEMLKMSFDLELPEADVILMKNENDFNIYKNQKWISPYISKNAKKIKDEYKNKEGYYTACSLNADDTANYISLINGAVNTENGKLLIDYILSDEGQKLLGECGLKPIK